MTAENRPPQMHSARVLTFRRGQTAARRPASGPVPDLAKYEHGQYGLDQGSDDYRHRMIVNLAAFVFVVALISPAFGWPTPWRGCARTRTASYPDGEAARRSP